MSPEISILGDFSVHHHLWLSSPFTDHPGSPKAVVPLAVYLCQMEGPEEVLC
ncbi:hypothetical protein E2C01_011054 [Portunus trituberculatus]|uniref:Uncharacterized protein n=1 Tax=Portunus trituberculatus TaxID=210409 RepID=A0A5B7DA03_PORTR|nr:hypothetical protein [Portunus trituberculatus]